MFSYGLSQMTTTSINAQVYHLNETLKQLPLEDVTAELIDNKIKSILLSLKEQDDDILEVVQKLEATRDKYK